MRTTRQDSGTRWSRPWLTLTEYPHPPSSSLEIPFDLGSKITISMDDFEGRPDSAQHCASGQLLDISGNWGTIRQNLNAIHIQDTGM